MGTKLHTNKLKLHRVDDEVSNERDDARTAHDVLPFPTQAVRGVQSLVAGRVSGSASSGHDFSPRAGADAENAHAGFSLPNRDDVISSNDLIRNIENTLESMQRRLDRVKRELDGSLKFPSPRADDDNDRPFAA